MHLHNRGLRRAKRGLAALVRFATSHRIGLSLGLVAVLLLVGSLPQVPLGGQSNRPRALGKHEHDSALQIRKRAEWFFHQRAFPLGHIPADARLKAFQQAAQMRRTKGLFMDRFAAATGERHLPPGA